ncbi:MAG TPA: YihY family inner membrane protein [Arenibaculum sp.]|nr:YihY family inner membrane protein [Arenibaculum sp.]
MKIGVARLPAALSFLEGRPQQVASFLQFLGRRFIADDCPTTASALTYTALLALVPLMTIFFAIFQAFPAYETLIGEAQRLLINSLVPEVGEALIENLNQFTANAGRLTGFGVIGLAVTSVLLFSTIEGSFRAIWRVTEPRPIIIRVLAFWALLTMTPLLFGGALSLSSTLLARLRIEDFAAPWLGWTFLLPGLVEFAGFFLIYLIIPNREVRWQDAATGAGVAAVLLEISKGLFGWYVAAFPTYQTIYGALSVIPIFLLWLYIAWSTVLVGAEVAAALPEWRAGLISNIGPEGLLPAQRIVVALALLKELIAAGRLGVGMRRRTLIKRLPVGGAVVDGMLEQLRHAHWVARTSTGAWVGTRDLSEATLYDLMKALHIGMRGNIRGIGSLDEPWQDRCEALLESSERSARDMLCIPIKQLLEQPSCRRAGAGRPPG